MTFLPKLTPEKNQILFARLLNTDVSRFSYPDTFRHFDMSVSLHMHLNGTSEGFVAVVDFTGMSFGHMAKTGIVHLKKTLYYLQEVFPYNLKQIHLINPVPFMDKVMAFLKPVMNCNILKMVEVHTTLESFFDRVPLDCLPKDYGGTCDSLEVLQEVNKKLMVDNYEFFIEEEKQVVDESKRPTKSKIGSTIFGFEGTFKKLDSD